MIQPRRADDCRETQLVPVQLSSLVVRALSSRQEVQLLFLVMRALSSRQEAGNDLHFSRELQGIGCELEAI